MLAIGRKQIGIVCVISIAIYSIYVFLFENYSSTALRYLHSWQDVSYNDCEAEMKSLNDDAPAQDDPRLLRVIQQCFLEPPSPHPYNLTKPNLEDYSQGGQALYVDSLMNHSENGFFVESGAFDGEKFSNSLLFEKYRRWTGLLIEPVQKSFKILRTKHRKAFISGVCLSKSQYPEQMVIKVQSAFSRLTNQPVSQFNTRQGADIVQCFPLYSLLLAVGRTKIDFFSLDIEGDELTVLKTIPWQNVDIKVLAVEYNHIREGVKRLIDFMVSKDYAVMPIIRGRRGWQDVFFVKHGFNYNSNFTF